MSAARRAPSGSFSKLVIKSFLRPRIRRLTAARDGTMLSINFYNGVYEYRVRGGGAAPFFRGRDYRTFWLEDRLAIWISPVCVLQRSGGTATESSYCRIIIQNEFNNNYYPPGMFIKLYQQLRDVMMYSIDHIIIILFNSLQYNSFTYLKTLYYSIANNNKISYSFLFLCMQVHRRLINSLLLFSETH